jgi:hypothetical protein
MKSEVERLAEAVKELGTLSREGVVQKLEDHGVRGWYSSSCCPLAIYFSLKIGRPVHVGSDRVWVTRDGPSINLPPSCRLFVSGFDHGMYEELEA